MSNTSLNLLAIAIFTITMSALLAPLTGLSPLVPAGVTVLLLGLYGIDTAYGNGERGAAAIAWLESHLPGYKQQKERVLYHEAGHFLASHLLGIKIIGYNLELKAGVEVDASLSLNSASLNILERYCTVWMAGIAAEEYIYQKALGGVDDLQKLNSATSHLPNPQLQQRWAMIRAKNLITENSQAFKCLVEKMRQSASVEDCCGAINQVDQDCQT